MEGYTLCPVFFISQLVDCSTTLPLEIFIQRNFVAEFIRLKLTFIQKVEKTLFDFLSHLWGT